MLQRSRLARHAWFFAALFQFLLPAFASVADARAEIESRGVHAHIEVDGAVGCPRIHPEDCVVCRVLAAVATTGSAASVQVPIVRTIDAAPLCTDSRWRATRAAGDPPQRAPPA